MNSVRAICLAVVFAICPWSAGLLFADPVPLTSHAPAPKPEQPMNAVVESGGSGDSGRIDPAPLRKIDLSKQIVLRYLVVTNKRLPAFTGDEIARALEVLTARTRTIIGADILFEPAGGMSIEDFFRKYIDQDQYRLDLARYYVEVNNDGVDAIDKLSKNMIFSMRNTSVEEIRSKIAHGIPSLGTKGLSRDDLLGAAAAYQIESLKKLYGSPALDGQKIFDNKDFFQYLAWNLAGRNQDTFDVVITNQAIASAEIPTNLAIALRGGLNTGITITSTNRLQGVVIMSTYPVIGEDRFVRSERPTPYADPAQVFGGYMVHELGHLLKRYGHPVEDDPGCYMTPIDSLDYLGWIAAVKKSGGHCTIEPPILSTYE